MTKDHATVAQLVEQWNAKADEQGELGREYEHRDLIRSAHHYTEAASYRFRAAELQAALAQGGAHEPHGWTCHCSACGPLLNFLNGISPSLLNTPKRNSAGEAVLSIEKSIQIALADYRQLLESREVISE